MIELMTTDQSHFRFDEFRREITDYVGEDKNVVIPSHIDGVEVVSIGPDAFWHKGLTSVILPQTLSVIGFYSFAFNKLKYVYIPPSVGLIEDGAFMFNEIEELKLGENIFSIPHSGFRHNKLSKIVFPENCQEIASDAFSDNPITEIEFKGAPTFIHRHTFNLGTKEMAGVTVTGVDVSGLNTLLNYHAKYIDRFRSVSKRYK